MRLPSRSFWSPPRAVPTVHEKAPEIDRRIVAAGISMLLPAAVVGSNAATPSRRAGRQRHLHRARVTVGEQELQRPSALQAQGGESRDEVFVDLGVGHALRALDLPPPHVGLRGRNVVDGPRSAELRPRQGKDAGVGTAHAAELHKVHHLRLAARQGDGTSSREFAVGCRILTGRRRDRHGFRGRIPFKRRGRWGSQLYLRRWELQGGCPLQPRLPQYLLWELQGGCPLQPRLPQYLLIVAKGRVRKLQRQSVSTDGSIP